MRIFSTSLTGVFVIEPEPKEDERGYFARTWCREEFEKRGLKTEIAQCSLSHNRKRGTIRGLHYQAPPHEEVKIVTCTRGAIFDVAVDVRADSPTFKQWVALELSQENRRHLYIPEGFAHGFQTLRDRTDVFYQISRAFYPSASVGIRWDDPSLGIEWPIRSKLVISARDRAIPFIDDICLVRQPGVCKE